MRAIRFRAWDTETKEMSYDFLSKNWLKVCIESPYVELMQYTGLTDRNGKEIYEGDILRSTYGGDTYHDIVNWDAQAGAWYFNPANGLDAVSWQDVKEPEVVGNIYENPEHKGE